MSDADFEHKTAEFFSIVEGVSIPTENVIVTELAAKEELKRALNLFVLNKNLAESDVEETREAIVLRVAKDYCIDPALSDRAVAMCEWLIELERKENEKQHGEA